MSCFNVETVISLGLFYAVLHAIASDSLILFRYFLLTYLQGNLFLDLVLLLLLFVVIY